MGGWRSDRKIVTRSGRGQEELVVGKETRKKEED
jgi:hypothetical protein